MGNLMAHTGTIRCRLVLIMLHLIIGYTVYLPYNMLVVYPAMYMYTAKSFIRIYFL